MSQCQHFLHVGFCLLSIGNDGLTQIVYVFMNELELLIDRVESFIHVLKKLCKLVLAHEISLA